jgi:cellobiose-specific phosphotransferase system component IIA
VRDAKRKPLTSDQIRTALVGGVDEATARVSAANEIFNEAISQFPGGLPHPYGIQRIRKASKHLEHARREMITAHKRLTEFIERGIVPQDLKLSG